MVVEDSTALLFGEGRFPTVDCRDGTVCNALGDIIKETMLNRVMLEAALRGSIGSVAIVMRVFHGRLFFEVMDTLYLTPTWRRDAPDTLEQVVERRKVLGVVLREQGYAIEDGVSRARNSGSCGDGMCATRPGSYRGWSPTTPRGRCWTGSVPSHTGWDLSRWYGYATCRAAMASTGRARSGRPSRPVWRSITSSRRRDAG